MAVLAISISTRIYATILINLLRPAWICAARIETKKACAALPEV
jgi:hypothetical protein